LYNSFSTYDVDGNGELSKDELKSFMDASGVMPPHASPGGIGMARDTDSAGTSLANANAESIISQYDTNADGVLSSSELQAYLDNSNSTSLITLVQQALSAYAMNSGNGQASGLESAFVSAGGLNSQFPIDISA
jgi:EF-hand domain pair